MRRRDFIGLIGATAVAWPLTARTQPSVMPVIGFLSGDSPAQFESQLGIFRDALRQAGYVEGQNVAIEYRWAEGQSDRLPGLAADLVSRKVNVIVAPGSTPASLAAKAATATIPIVFFTAGDPVALGLVTNLSRPGGNATGTTSLGVELAPKRLGLLHELIPTATAMGLLVNPTNLALAASTESATQDAARTQGLQLRVLRASAEPDFDQVFADLVQMGASALVIAIDTLFTSRRQQLAALALRHGVPAIYQYRDFAAAGGVLSYGGTLTEPYGVVGLYTGRILKGENPADLPVQQAAKIELIINLKTAKALGLSVPPTLLASADDVIQ